ncbi:MAG TPA: VCBS repeat-containing protein, partial [Verrucomicrobiae bacterium]|nr:VCBS repeat-containing protein [Verrucomicrobiae bacterium]
MNDDSDEKGSPSVYRRELTGRASVLFLFIVMRLILGNSDAALPNTPPVVSTISEQAFAPGQTIPPISFSVADAESGPDVLVISATSTNQTIVRDSDIAVTGSGTEHFLQISPLPGKRGVTTVLVTATDEGGLATTNQFVLRIEEFTTIYQLPNAGGAGYGGIADFDGDGNYDLYARDNFTVWLNRGGAFTKADPPTGSLQFTAVTLADFNGDGYLDVIGTGPLNGSTPGTRLLENRGDGTFLVRTNSGLLGFAFGDRGGIAVGDFDNDGDMDVVLSGWTNSTLSGPFVTKVFLNTGRGVFFESGISLPPLIEGFSSAADINSDGMMDLLLAGATNAAYRGIASVFFNQSGTNFARSALNLPPYVRGCACLADFDNDTRLDLLIMGSENSIVSGRPARLYLNDGTGGFSFKTNALPASSWTALCADYNNDGNLDVLFLPANESFATAFLFKNDGSGSLIDSGIPLKATDFAGFFDFDHDGALDLAIGTSDSIQILRNNLHTTNTPPTVPRNLLSQISAGVVTLSWEQSTDLEQKGGLTYNLRVGTAPGKNDVMPSMSSASGQLLRPREGNAWLNTNWMLKLPAGKYYWTVQAIDHGYVASPFAEEQTFQVDQPLPKILTGAATNIASTGAALTALVEGQSPDTLIWFEYGTSDNLGSFTSPRKTQLAQDGDVLMQEPIWQLPPKTNIFFRAAASNSVGLVYGITRSLTTFGYTNFTGFDLSTNGVTLSQLFAVDLDGDGSMELALFGIPLFFDGSFVLRVFHKTALGPYEFSDVNLGRRNKPSLAWCDYDLDGDLDLAFSGIGTDGLPVARIFRND